MRLDEFAIGMPFRRGDHLLRCTDIGTRTVVAIRIDEVEIAGTAGNRTLDRRAAEAEGWFCGPPYPVAEIVFDEDDQEECEPEGTGA